QRNLSHRPKQFKTPLKHGTLLRFRQPLVELADPLFQPVHPEDELLALGQELRLFFARHGETRLSMRSILDKLSQPSKEGEGSANGMPVFVRVATAGEIPAGSGR